MHFSVVEDNSNEAREATSGTAPAVCQTLESPAWSAVFTRVGFLQRIFIEVGILKRM